MAASRTPDAFPNRAFTFYARGEYYADLARRIKRLKKGSRVMLATMTFEPRDPLIARIVDELHAAAKRGVECSLAIDAHMFMISQGADRVSTGPLFGRTALTARMQPYYREKFDALQSLRASGVTCAVTNYPARPLQSPFSNRSHIKLAIIDNRLYIGGCNLSHSSQIDMMVGWDDQRTADWLCELEGRIIAEESTHRAMLGTDQTFEVDDQTTLYVDSGKKRQSVIYDTALRLIDEAEKSVLITCQYFPNHVTAHRLSLAAERGVEVTIVFNHPDKHSRPLHLVHRGVIAFERRRRPASFFTAQLPLDSEYLHAKLIATEKAALIGSHNYVKAGVNWGTAEIALLRRDPVFAQQAIKKLYDATK